MAQKKKKNHFITLRCSHSSLFHDCVILRFLWFSVNSCWGRCRKNIHNNQTQRVTLTSVIFHLSLGLPKVFAVFSPYTSRHIHPSSRSMLKSTSVSGEIYTLERTDGSQSDTALGTLGGGGKKRRSSLSARVVAIVGIPSRRSRSTSQLSQTGETLPANCILSTQQWHCSSIAPNKLTSI